MSFKKTLFALLILFLLLGYAYFDKRQTEKNSRENREKSIALKADWQQLASLSFKTNKADILFKKLDKKDEEQRDLYQIVSPIKARPDQFLVRDLINNLKDLKISKTINEKPQNLKEYGLEQPALKIQLNFKEKPNILFFLGDNNPDNSGSYFRLNGDKTVYLVNKGLDLQKEKKLFNFRDKKVFSLKAAELNYFSITYPLHKKSTTFIAEKEADKWQIISPKKIASDSAKIEGQISSWSLLRVDSFVSEKADKDLKKYGLDKPAAILTLRNKNNRQQALIVGQPQTDKKNRQQKNLYARIKNEQVIFKLRSDLAEELKINIDDYQLKKGESKKSKNE